MSLTKALKRHIRMNLNQAIGRFRPIYICGIAGSGTSLIASLLDQHYENRAFANESAKMCPDKSVLHMKSVSDYGNFETYYKSMFVSDDVSVNRVRSDTLRHYMKISRWTLQTSIVIDKGPNVHLVRSHLLREAFPEAGFVLIFRSPVDAVEGLRRKWPEFDRAELETVCDFWNDTHNIFMDVNETSGNVIYISLESLKKSQVSVLEMIGNTLGLVPRTTPKVYSNKPNVIGKGLRNVQDGIIKIDKSQVPKTQELTHHEQQIVEQLCRETYERLQNKEFRPN